MKIQHFGENDSIKNIMKISFLNAYWMKQSITNKQRLWENAEVKDDKEEEEEDEKKKIEEKMEKGGVEVELERK